MVVINPMGWLSDSLKRSLAAAESKRSSASSSHLGILSFETAKTMSRLVSLYRSLDDAEISNLRKLMRSEGVAYLNSRDESFLLILACAERLEDLDKAAATVARLGHKCSDFGLNRFDLVYADLKLGIIDLGKLEYGSKDTEKRIDKMDKLILATSRLYAALESLTELEVSERKLKQWKQNCRGFQTQSPNFDLFDQKIAFQRKQVRHYRETSLWSQTFDKSVGLMARIVCIVYARICVVFGPASKHREIFRVRPEVCFIEPAKEQIISHSGPIQAAPKSQLARFHSQKSIIFSSDDSGGKNRVFHLAGPSTVGGSGLALRYANVIILAERYLDSAVTIGDGAREDLYQMLPENLRMVVRSKLSKNIRVAAATGDDDDGALAEGWREALMEMMGWLTPMARDTIKWQTERNFEKMQFESKPSAFLLHTLHFSDKEKAEAAIAEVLVGLSCIYRYENRRNCGDDEGDDGGDKPVGNRCSFDGIRWC